MTKPMYDKSTVRLAGDTAHEARAAISEHSAEDLATAMVNAELNRFIADASSSSFSEDRESTPIPYQGWFWRSVDFFSPRGVTIASGDGQVAVCQNNKWDYPERDLTETEQAEFLGLVWSAYGLSRQGGVLSEIQERTHAALVKAGAFISELSVSR